MANSTTVPTREQIENTKAKMQAEWTEDERCLRQLVAILRQRQLASQLAAIDTGVLTSRAG